MQIEEDLSRLMDLAFGSKSLCWSYVFAFFNRSTNQQKSPRLCPLVYFVSFSFTEDLVLLVNPGVGYDQNTTSSGGS